MLRAIVVLLLLGTGVLLAWQQGWLGASLQAPSQQGREPDRLQRQVNPELVRVLSPVAASAALAEAARSATAAALVASAQASAAATAPACLEAGPFATAELPAAQEAMRKTGLPAASWTTVNAPRKGVFIIYMGRYPDSDIYDRKRDELRRLKIDAQVLKESPDLQPGLVLGRFDDKPAADAELARLTQRGVRTARVLALSTPVTLSNLRLPAASAEQRSRLEGVQLPPGGIGFGPCAVTPANL